MTIHLSPSASSSPALLSPSTSSSPATLSIGEPHVKAIMYRLKVNKAEQVRRKNSCLVSLLSLLLHICHQQHASLCGVIYFKSRSMQPFVHSCLGSIQKDVVSCLCNLLASPALAVLIVVSVCNLLAVQSSCLYKSPLQLFVPIVANALGSHFSVLMVANALCSQFSVIIVAKCLCSQFSALVVANALGS